MRGREGRREGGREVGVRREGGGSEEGGTREGGSVCVYVCERDEVLTQLHAVIPARCLKTAARKAGAVDIY